MKRRLWQGPGASGWSCEQLWGGLVDGETTKGFGEVSWLLRGSHERRGSGGPGGLMQENPCRQVLEEENGATRGNWVSHKRPRTCLKCSKHGDSGQGRVQHEDTEDTSSQRVLCKHSRLFSCTPGSDPEDRPFLGYTVGAVEGTPAKPGVQANRGYGMKQEGAT